MYLPLASGKFCASVNKNLRQSRVHESLICCPEPSTVMALCSLLASFTPRGAVSGFEILFPAKGCYASYTLREVWVYKGACTHVLLKGLTQAPTWTLDKMYLPRARYMPVRKGTYLHYLHLAPLLCLVNSFWCSGLSLHCTPLEKSLLISLNVCFMSLLCTPKILLFPF